MSDADPVKHHPVIMPTRQGCRLGLGEKEGYTVECVCGWPGRHPAHVYETPVSAHLDFGRHLLDPEYGWSESGKRCR